MISVEVVRVEGRPPAVPMAVSFNELGGTIGRGADCTLVLSDDKRSVSRVHASLSFDQGQYRITDQGTNALRVNGNALGKGNTAVVKSGDQITIGPFELEVRSGAPQPPTVADSPLLGAPSAPAAKGGAGAGANLFDDLLGGPTPGPGASASDPFADLGFSSSAAPTAAPPSSPSHGAGLPDDFDLMAPPPASPDSMLPSGADLPDDVFSGLHSSPDAPGSGSLDSMFGLSSGSSAEPFMDGPLGKPAGTPGSHDSGITQWVGGPGKVTQNSVADNVPEINSPFIVPPTAAPANKPAPAPAPPPSAPAPKASPPDLDLDLDDIFGIQSSGPAEAPRASAAPTPSMPMDFDFDAPAAPTPAPAPAPAPESRPELPASSLSAPAPQPKAPPPAPPPPMTSATPDVARGYQRPPPAAPQPVAPPAVPAEQAELLEALMAGLNAQDLSIDALTPELMYRIGSLMHEATAGTIALLNARGTVKREMRADVTMIASGRNNPLKFSPDARLALRYLFGPQMPGFMGADEAMRDAYADLRAHEFGFMAGLRAALSGVLKRFDPALLESRLPDKGGLGMLGGGRKGKLWDLFSELYRQLALEAEEDFHALFGREFLRAYEEHVAALERQRQKKGS